MFVRRKIIKGNYYFYLVENIRVDKRPVQKVILYLGNRTQAILLLESSSYPEKDKLLSQVKATKSTTGLNKGKRGRPRKEAQSQEVLETVFVGIEKNGQISIKSMRLDADEMNLHKQRDASPKILVIENNAVSRNLLIAVLENKGFDTIGAENGLAGIQQAKKHLPDLVICDLIEMPDMDGYSVLTALRQDPVTAVIPFIFLSANNKLASIRKAMELGADDYLTKPSTIEELLRAIAVRLEKQAILKSCYANKSHQVSEALHSSVNPKSIFPSIPQLQAVFDFIEANYCQGITLSDVAFAVGYSSAYLTNRVARETGETVNAWIVKRRMAAARSLLKDTNQSIEQIAIALGYQDVAHFSRQFRQHHGLPPKAWRKQQQIIDPSKVRSCALNHNLSESEPNFTRYSQ